MNILVLSADGIVSLRPDSGINKNNTDFYVPDGMEEVEFTPVAVARIAKAGKSVEKEFAPRYYDAVNFGILVYPSGSTIVDRSSYLPLPLYNTVVLSNPENRFVVTVDGAPAFECSVEGIAGRLEDAIMKCSLNTSLRRGDYVLAELDSRKLLCNPSTGQKCLHATFCGNDTVDFAVIF